jgi:hypothetical protein
MLKRIDGAQRETGASQTLASAREAESAQIRHLEEVAGRGRGREEDAGRQDVSDEPTRDDQPRHAEDEVARCEPP